MEKNEIQKLFEDLTPADKPLVDEIKKEEEKAPEKEEAKAIEKVDEPRKNRRHRRLEQQLEEERSSRQVLEERLKNLETKRLSEETKDLPIPDKWTRIYGDTPEAKMAWQLFSEMSAANAQKAKEEALSEFESRQSASEKEEKGYEDYIDDQFENLEEEHDVDLTSDSPSARKTRSEFIEVVRALSPKDEDGNITAYADFEGAWNVYQSQQTKSETTNRQKEIASRSMQKSGSTDVSKDNDDATRQWLRENGINV